MAIPWAIIVASVVISCAWVISTKIACDSDEGPVCDAVGFPGRDDGEDREDE